MVDPQASRFWQAGLQSGLLDADGLRACWEAIPPEKRDPDQLDRRLARQAVQSGRLTLWQAQQLLAGRSTGFKIDRYVLLELLGQGGMGRVYLARDSRLNRRVALKILSPERVNNPRAIARFQREARVGAQLQHENLVRIYDEGESNGRCYLVMEYIEGKTIGAMIAEQGRIAPATAARLVRQVAFGLDHAHEKGLIHRDVNPYNILVTPDGTAKLTDLGLAIDLTEQIPVTREGATVGTFDYVSPEQARHSHSVDTRSDIYSLGCTLYHMLTGQVPFPSPSLPEKLFGHQAVEPEPLESLAPEVPAGLGTVVRTMMRKAPEGRYANPKELAEALAPFVVERAAPTTTSRIVATRPAVPGPRPAVAEPRTAPAPSSTSTPPLDPAPAVAADAGTPAPATAGAAPAVGSGEDLMKMFPAIDLGPTPSLTEGLAWAKKSRTKTSGSVSQSNTPDPEGVNPGPAATPQAPPRPLSPVRVAVAAILALVVVVLLAILVIQRSTDAGSTSAREKGKGKTAATDPGAGVGARPRGVPAPKGGTEVPGGNPFAVLTRDGEITPEESLKAAMLRAMGSKGQVLLNNPAPLTLGGDDRAILLRLSDPLSIRAAEGARPVLEVEIQGDRPFLMTGAPLTIAGVTIVARYAESAKGPPPLIEAGSRVRLDRCAFRATGAVKGSCAVAAQGGGLTAIGCWFEGFETALDVAAFAGSAATIHQCLFVGPRAQGRPTGWGVRLRHMPGGAGGSARRLSLERCTMTGEGLLDLVDFSPASPLTVTLHHCAVLADALIAWEATSPADRSSLAWAGRGNLYDLRGKSWVVSARDGSAAPAGAPADFQAWAREFPEVERRDPPIKFRTDPESLPESPRPADFALALDAAAPVGADPAQVGPGPAKGR